MIETQTESQTETYTEPETQRDNMWFLQQPLVRINPEVVAFVVVIVLSVVGHLWGLGNMAMHHDESIHAWSTWNFYAGRGGFNCYDPNPKDNIPSTSPTYCYDPVYHGPSLYILGLGSFFLFGDGEAQSRLPMAVAGILMVVSAWMLRPLIGKWGAFVAAILLGFAPSLLYFTRFNRHDGLMILWELWMVIGIFRYMQSRQPRFLYLLAAGLALAIGTHELYYILFFIFGMFVLIRLMSELLETRYMHIGLLAAIGLCIVLIVVNPPLPIGEGLYLGEKALLVGVAVLLGWLCLNVWPREKVLLERLDYLWTTQRFSMFIAIGIFVGLYLVQYTTFFAHPRGAIDGLYAGLAYWLGSQHDYARGDQPWYYYIMQLPLYEPLGVVTGIGAALYLFVVVPMRRLGIIPGFSESQAIEGPSKAQQEGQEIATNEDKKATTKQQAERKKQGADTHNPSNARRKTKGKAPDEATTEEDSIKTIALDPSVREAEPQDGRQDGEHDATEGYTQQETATTDDVYQPGPIAALFPLLLLFWYISAIVLFSWAGEKMPWLVVHMALPGNLVAAWALGRLLSTVDTVDKSQTSTMLLVPPVVFLLITTLGVAMWRLGASGEGQEAQHNAMQGLFPLIIGGGLIYALLTIGQKIGGRVTVALSLVTVSAILGAYMLRATWLAVYEHPDTPVELLVYTQSSPDVPRYVADIEELAINLTRNNRTDEDEAGGLSMPIIVDSGDASGNGSLAWPYQWYFRHFNELSWVKSETYQENPRSAFTKKLPDGSEGLAPVVMLYKAHINDNVQAFLEANYVRPYGEGGALNWWFPEGSKCSPDSDGYKRYYFNTWTPVEELTASGPKGCGSDISAELEPPWAPLLWPLTGKCNEEGIEDRAACKEEHNKNLWEFLLYRKLPGALKPGSRAMQIWVRNDMMTGTGSGTASTSGAEALRLVATAAIGGSGQLNGPTGIAVDKKGNVYVADTKNHRIQIFDDEGTLKRTIGSLGSGEKQFNEPRSIAIDSQGNIYVADTWNARIVKLSADGEWIKTWGSGEQELSPGRMATITDGTKEGNAANQLGFFGPRGIAISPRDNVFIADTGNKRIVVTDNEGNYLYQWGHFGHDHGMFSEPTGLGIDAGGNVYVADTWNSRVQVFSPDEDGRVKPIPEITWPVTAWKPDTYDDPSIGVSPDGQVYVSLPKLHTVLAANMRGDVLLRWGGKGDDLASLNLPSGIAVGPDDGVYVVDREHGRVLRFEVPAIRPSE